MGNHTHDRTRRPLDMWRGSRKILNGSLSIKSIFRTFVPDDILFAAMHCPYLEI